MLSLIGRLRKEKEDIFVVTGSKNNRNKRCPGVFQEYRFDFQSISIQHIMESVQPDCVIFTAAFDDTEENRENEVVAYIAGITNLLIATKKTGVKQFYYLTTESGFLEEKDSMIRLGQEICENFKNSEEQQIRIADLGEVYGCYKKIPIKDSICTKLCERVLEMKPQEGNKGKLHHIIYVDDAVEAVFRILQEEKNQKLHVIHGSRGYTEETLYHMLSKIGAGTLLNTEEDNIESEERQELNLHILEKYSLGDGLKRLYTGVKETFVPKESLYGSEKKNFFLNIQKKNKYLPFIENILLFALLQLIVSVTGEASIYETIDVYLFYVLIFSVTYGMLQAVFSVILSVLGRFYIMITSHGILMIFEEYNKYLWILQIFIVGVMVGYLKDKYRKRLQDHQEEEEYLRAELTNLTEINKSNIEVKEVYESRLLSYKDSFVNMYEVVQQLDDMESYKVVFNTISVVCEIVGSKDVAIYMCDKYEKYARLLASSSEYGRLKGKSLELAKFQEMHIRVKSQEIYANTSLAEEYPILAGGTYDQGKLKMIIAIWTLPYENNNLNQVNTFSVACKLVDRTLSRAYQYMDSIFKSTHVGDYNILTKDAFENIVHLYDYGYKKGFLQYSMVLVTGYAMKPEEFYNKLKRLIRDTDFAGEVEGDKVALLLTNTETREADFVMERLKENQIEAELISVN